MRSNSDHYPEITIQSNGKTQVRYNIEETTRTEMDGKTRTVYNYDYVEIEGEVTKEKIIEAIFIAEKLTEPVLESIIIPETIIDTRAEEIRIEVLATEAIVEVKSLKKAGISLEEYRISMTVNIEPIETSKEELFEKRESK